ncbi:transposase [Streptomyces sp. NPDC059616]|uniref:transposase n=1 Tax=Streptomyces sp. NPDC059616 TaxID=3346886 RepID=UPI0036AD2BB5
MLTLEGVDLRGTALEVQCGVPVRRDALWRASAGRRTFKDVAADLNVNPETLRTWVRDADGRPVAAGASRDTEAELARLRAENARLAKAEKEWQLEREILRRAAAYFAREMK